MSARLRNSTPADEPALRALWDVCFDAPHIGALHALDPDRHRRTFVAETAGGRLDAVVVWVPRLIRDAHGTPRRVGGIGSVATRPEARGQGLVRRLLAGAERSMTAEGCAWSLLFTGTPGVYRGSGWQEFTTGHMEGTIRHTPASAAYRVREATVADAGTVRALHSAYNAARPLSSLRTDEDWAVRVPAWYGPPERALVAEAPDTGAVRGWLVAGYAGECAEVREFAGDSACLPDLLGAVAARGLAAGHHRARVRLPAIPEVMAALPALLADSTAVETRTGMARPLLAGADAVRDTVTAAGAVHWYGDSF
ncbi:MULTISPECIES: GNAT family N-acetyltransferase [unclassified Streptomyces]|uniref:GNAT family N-acetyltransferase n=1 Tax=unclassified Streptomyces TaxID=2593676 RepID=UPI00093FDA95|nr:GNAT family N-acetyltransferase [Streptomyces sp. CB02058]OKI91129.1 hypothetical protein AMK10_30030 [Streptomyces sp. CB02058]